MLGSLVNRSKHPFVCSRIFVSSQKSKSLCSRPFLGLLGQRKKNILCLILLHQVSSCLISSPPPHQSSRPHEGTRPPCKNTIYRSIRLFEDQLQETQSFLSFCIFGSCNQNFDSAILYLWFQINHSESLFDSSGKAVETPFISLASLL